MITCAVCDQPLAGQPARATDAGFVHAVCPGKACAVTDCDRLIGNNGGRGWCYLHWRRWHRTGSTDDPKRIVFVLEDVEWMAATGENATGAARRLGIQRGSLQKRLAIEGRADLYKVLAGREGDWNASPNREAVVRAKRYDKKAA